jgi:hypothetical protein
MAQVHGQDGRGAQHLRTQLKLPFGDGRSAEDLLVMVLPLPSLRPPTWFLVLPQRLLLNQSYPAPPACCPQHIISHRKTRPLRCRHAGNAAWGRIITQPLELQVRRPGGTGLGWGRIAWVVDEMGVGSAPAVLGTG